ncbi:hypothetical protein FCM35_KLT08238 [Carex littledalei]|uniref:Uncharacterized protein n=1 Tax=Carex littledalei TaxID=544730 RepID=A0A833VKB4_9POAL|nr:hypothetical protein FCM35_KLT08238 [Carex littledalei]
MFSTFLEDAIIQPTLLYFHQAKEKALFKYQRLSPDCLPLPAATTGRKSDLTPNPNPTPVSNSNPNANQGRVSPNSDAKSRSGRFTSDAPSTSTSANHGEISGGDLLLQWGHNKRTRGPRTGQAGDDSASHLRASKIQRRSSVGTTAAEKLMPPPQLPVGSYTRGANLRSAVSVPNHHSWIVVRISVVQALPSRLSWGPLLLFSQLLFFFLPSTTPPPILTCHVVI